MRRPWFENLSLGFIQEISKTSCWSLLFLLNSNAGNIKRLGWVKNVNCLFATETHYACGKVPLNAAAVEISVLPIPLSPQNHRCNETRKVNPNGTFFIAPRPKWPNLGPGKIYSIWFRSLAKLHIKSVPILLAIPLPPLTLNGMKVPFFAFFP